MVKTVLRIGYFPMLLLLLGEVSLSFKLSTHG